MHGDRDLSKFADPLMQLIQSLGNGGLRQFAVIKSVQTGDTLITEVQPSNHNDFERVKNAILAIDDSGQLKKVSINFKSGDADETEFKSWTLLAQNDPEILSLNDRLSKLSDQESNQERAPANAFPRVTMACQAYWRQKKQAHAPQIEGSSHPAS